MPLQGEDQATTAIKFVQRICKTLDPSDTRCGVLVYSKMSKILPTITGLIRLSAHVKRSASSQIQRCCNVADHN